MAYTTGNIMAVINDGAADPINNPRSPQNRPENTALVPISVGRWPFLFVVTLTDIAAGMFSQVDAAFASLRILLYVSKGVHRMCLLSDYM